ncbi:MAG: proliferating cell nuclear antigen (pcna) [Candidatus Micrarchaeota archaeon]|nr:proliferating cell nuclear antigen (pcna) [Candidatus Micrarchaeota archaeon]
MAFRFVVGDVRRYKNAIDAIVNLIAEGQLEVGRDGLFLRAMDPSQVAMVSFSMPSSSFSEYEAPLPPAKVGLNFDNLSKILSRVREGERLEISQGENKVQLRFISTKRKRSFKVPILDMPAGATKEPSVQHDVIVKVNGGHFRESLRDAELVGVHITLEATEKGFAIEVHGDSTDLTEESEMHSEEVIEMKMNKPARATFPLEYLVDMVKACPENSPLTLYLKSNAPLKMEYEVEGAKVVYYLAPRIESD